MLHHVAGNRTVRLTQCCRASYAKRMPGEAKVFLVARYPDLGRMKSLLKPEVWVGSKEMKEGKNTSL